MTPSYRKSVDAATLQDDLKKLHRALAKLLAYGISATEVPTHHIHKEDETHHYYLNQARLPYNTYKGQS